MFHTNPHMHTMRYNIDMVAFWPFIFPNAIHTCTNCIQPSRTYTLKGRKINTKRAENITNTTVDMMIENTLNKSIQTRRMDIRGNNTNNICLASDNQYHHKHHTHTNSNAWLCRSFFSWNMVYTAIVFLLRIKNSTCRYICTSHTKSAANTATVGVLSTNTPEHKHTHTHLYDSKWMGSFKTKKEKTKI